MKLLSDKNFLDAIHSYERQLAKLLAVLLAIVVGVASIELVIQSGWKIVQLQTDWFDGSMIKLLDRLLLIFIALEVLQNVKPLFSFGGQGVMLNPTIDSINAINDPANWILQKKVNYASVIETPSGPSKAEIRLFYFWDKQLGRYVATNNLTRISKGPMIGVSYNNTATWIGGSISYFEQ